jgi:hypothetical protein
MIQEHGPGVLRFIANRKFPLESWMRGRTLDNLHHKVPTRFLDKAAHAFKTSADEKLGATYRHASPLELIMCASSTTVILIQNDVYLGKLLHTPTSPDYELLKHRFSWFVELLLDTGNPVEIHLVYPHNASFLLVEDARQVGLDRFSQG